MIISKQGYDFLDKIKDEIKKLNLKKTIHFTNDLKEIKEKISAKDIHKIQLDFYYSENVRIADEDISFSVDLGQLPKGNYDVRFFVYPKSKRLHRSTHCIVQIK